MNTFYIRRPGDLSSGKGLILDVNANLLVGTKDFIEEFGSLTSIEEDLLIIASSIFAADRAIKRGEQEDVARNFELNIPVTNIGLLLPLSNHIEQILRLLSNDGWRIKMRLHAEGPTEDIISKITGGKTLLFSGGLDSLAAAVEYGKSKELLQLVSHKTRNPITNTTQKKLAEILISNGYNVKHRQFFVSSKDGGPSDLQHDLENSQRTRSFVFLTLGALVAKRTGNHEIVFLAENGQMAIHLPLTQGRIGALSTHTAHPDVLATMQNYLSAALNLPISIINPYVHRTKKEVISRVVNELPAAIASSNSCWKSARIVSDATHCGECVPCYIRRIAIESLTTDTTSYARNVWAEKIKELLPSDEGRRNLFDLLEFIVQFRTKTNEEIMNEFPELYSQNIDSLSVIQMYKRFANEARTVFNKYPNIKGLFI